MSVKCSVKICVEISIAGFKNKHKTPLDSMMFRFCDYMIGKITLHIARVATLFIFTRYFAHLASLCFTIYKLMQKL